MPKIKRVKYLLFPLLVVILFGCDKAPALYRATLFNPTDHDIKILFYKSGIVHPGDTALLPPNSQFLLSYGSFNRGAQVARGFLSDHFGSPEDSIVVIFDSLYSITHYADAPVSLFKHYYLNNSLRNIGNPNSYEYTVMHDNGTVNDHKYYFTEQDYLDAKD